MPKARGKTPGWAAVDQKLRHGVELDLETDPYPPVHNAVASYHPGRNAGRYRDLSIKPVSSSVVVPCSADVGLTAMNKGMEHEQHTSGRVSSNKCKDVVVVDENVQKLPLDKLMERYCEADHSLIEDILLAVDGDFDSACGVLDEMYAFKSSSSNQEETLNGRLDLSRNDNDLGKILSDVNVQLKTMLERTHIFSGRYDLFDDSGPSLEPLEVQSINDAIARIRNSIKHSNLIPSEPEWEEDDVYLSHRKDATKLMRSAAQHSRMASSAFLKGDHYSAQHHSSRAREDWSAANNLNSEAAKDILAINNQNNNMWKLDLHGLHAVEAVKVLQNHLMMIEKLSTPHRSVSPKRVTSDQILAGFSSSESLGSIIKDIGQGASAGQRSTTLQVITGQGLHSKGHAVLPTAVRGFLDENGYRYDEPRPGVINVRPKFRHGRGLFK